MLKRIRIYRVTLDTNVFLSSLISPFGVNAKIINAWIDEHFILVISQEIIDEIIEVLNRNELIARFNYSKNVMDWQKCIIDCR